MNKPNALDRVPAQGTGPAWFEFGRAILVEHAQGQLLDDDAESGAPANDHAASIDEHRARLAESLTTGTAFSALASNAMLSIDDVEALALLATAESDLACSQLVESLLSPGRTQLTLGLVAQLLPPPHRGPRAFATDASLDRCAFTSVDIGGSWAASTVALHRSVVWALLGDPSVEQTLPIDTTYFEADPDSPIEVADDYDFVVVNGDDRMRRRERGAAHSSNQRFVCAPAPDDNEAWAALVREATITGRGLLVEVGDSLTTLSRRWLERITHLSVVLSARSGPAVDEMPRRQWRDVYAPATDPTHAEWAAVFGPDVARSHHLTFDQLHRVERTTAAVGGDIDAAVRRLSSGRIDQLTKRISPSHSWDDIVLSPERRLLLRSVVDRYQQSTRVYDDWGFSATPSRGLVALFSGPSGTGKTLASEIIAGELGLDLFKLDLSSVVSKYIGETEKNLEEVFDAASAGNLVLFFDEADALFGKRSEVKDARDRYANIEVSYLLQRLESYDGLVILATNFEKNVDEAFLRRIHARIAFALPGVEERAAIWLQNFPETAPTDDVDIDWLAEQFELSGGAIRNAAVHAGFTSAAAGTDITMEAAVLGVAREFRKMGRLIRSADFGKYHELAAD